MWVLLSGGKSREPQSYELLRRYLFCCVMLGRIPPIWWSRWRPCNGEVTLFLPCFFLPTDQSTNRLGTNESQQERNITTSSGKNLLSTKEKRGVATDITLIYSLDATPGYDHLQSSTPSIRTASFGLDSESPSWMNTTWTLNRIKIKDYLLWRP
jgi:hypothetical protein